RYRRPSRTVSSVRARRRIVALRLHLAAVAGRGGRMKGLQWLEQESGDGVLQREFTLERGERTVPGVLWTPKERATAKPLVLFGHGASGDRHQTPIPYVARKLVV